jgi:hypothetical protein
MDDDLVAAAPVHIGSGNVDGNGKAGSETAAKAKAEADAKAKAEASAKARAEADAKAKAEAAAKAKAEAAAKAKAEADAKAKAEAAAKAKAEAAAKAKAEADAKAKAEADAKAKAEAAAKAKAEADAKAKAEADAKAKAEAAKKAMQKDDNEQDLYDDVDDEVSSAVPVDSHHAPAKVVAPGVKPGHVVPPLPRTQPAEPAKTGDDEVQFQENIDNGNMDDAARSASHRRSSSAEKSRSVPAASGVLSQASRAPSSPSSGRALPPASDSHRKSSTWRDEREQAAQGPISRSSTADGDGLEAEEEEIRDEFADLEGKFKGDEKETLTETASKAGARSDVQSTFIPATSSLIMMTICFAFVVCVFIGYRRWKSGRSSYSAVSLADDDSPGTATEMAVLVDNDQARTSEIKYVLCLNATTARFNCLYSLHLSHCDSGAIRF